MIQRDLITDFLLKSEDHLIIDVRSPLEYEKGHVPGAKNIALFTNNERSVVGTLYKQEGKQSAILQGLDLVGPKLADYIKLVKSMTDKETVFVYCARGGMRSGSFGWLLSTYGYNVIVLESGYKAYRNFILEQFDKQLGFIVLSGKTGTGKTLLLHKYKLENKQIIDLEALACHKGSVFGGIGQEQPTQEQFENYLGFLISQFDASQKVWIEDESRHIGKRMIPTGLWDQMRKAPLQIIEKTKKERATLLMNEYEYCSNQDLLKAVSCLDKHLGSLRCLQAQELLNQNKRYEFCMMLLNHYDKAYEFSFAKRQKNNGNGRTI